MNDIGHSHYQRIYVRSIIRKWFADCPPIVREHGVEIEFDGEEKQIKSDSLHLVSLR